MSDPFDPIIAAHVLRELATEIQSASGAARNGLFLELHRLHDTIFRLNLESHPDLPPDLRGAVFNLGDPMPAPQVVRELNRLASPLAAKEIRSLYKHMNMARNNMAHDSVIGRVTISNSNVKRMVQLATLVATVLDPNPVPLADGTVLLPPRPLISRARLYLLVGVLVGSIVAAVVISSINSIASLGVAIVGLIIVGGLWVVGD